MQRIKFLTPAALLVAIVAVMLLGGPYMLRELAYAEQEGRSAAARQYLGGGPLLDLNESFRNVAKVVEPSVVHISVRRKPEANPLIRRFRGPTPDLRDFFRDPFSEPNPQEPQDPRGETKPPEAPSPEHYDVPQEAGNGSGWIYHHAPSNEDYIITNHHVVAQADELVVKLFDGSTARADVVGSDWKTEVAVLKIHNGKKLAPATLADRPVEQGEIVFAFGSPFQFEFSMSQGVVSGMSRELGMIKMRDPRTREIIEEGYENFIQTDAAINPGNSGGPLVNVLGQVVGMNTAIVSQNAFGGQGAFAGLGFAIPTDIIKQVADQLIESGKVSRGYLGVYIQDMDRDLAQAFGFEGQGVLVKQLTEAQSPAAKAGIGPEDIITAIEGKPVRHSAELRRRVAAIRPGSTIDVTVFREGAEKNFRVKLGQLEDRSIAAAKPGGPGESEISASDQMQTLSQLGLERFQTVTPDLARAAGLDATEGVLIEEVRPGSAAHAAGFQPGMIITRVGKTDVRNIEQMNEALAGEDFRNGVLFRINANGINHFLVLKLPR